MGSGTEAFLGAVVGFFIKRREEAGQMAWKVRVTAMGPLFALFCRVGKVIDV